MIFESMFSQLAPAPSMPANSITVDEYEQWKKSFTFDALKNKKYGQSFCDCFGIRDNRILYERNWQLCDHIIKKEWLARS